MERPGSSAPWGAFRAPQTLPQGLGRAQTAVRRLTGAECAGSALTCGTCSRARVSGEASQGHTWISAQDLVNGPSPHT